MLNKINSHKRDNRIRFRDKDHKYWIDENSSGLISCTTYIHTFFSKFDSKKIISNITSSYKHKNDPDYKYYRMSKKDIANLWKKNGKIASEKGTKLHSMIEDYYNDKEIEVDEDDVAFDQFMDFYEDNKELEMYRTEWMIFSEELKITGSIDAVFMNEDGTLTLGDWKRSKKINYDAYGKKVGKKPFEHLPDCNYYHYILQLNLYRIILERFYGFKIKDMFLGVFHPDNENGKYMKIDIPILEKEAVHLLKFREESITN
jgi:hypothetical protein